MVFIKIVQSLFLLKMYALFLINPSKVRKEFFNHLIHSYNRAPKDFKSLSSLSGLDFNQGQRVRSPTIRNYATDLLTFGVIAEVNNADVQ